MDDFLDLLEGTGFHVRKDSLMQFIVTGNRGEEIIITDYGKEDSAGITVFNVSTNFKKWWMILASLKLKKKVIRLFVEEGLERLDDKLIEKLNENS